MKFNENYNHLSIDLWEQIGIDSDYYIELLKAYTEFLDKHAKEGATLSKIIQIVEEKIKSSDIFLRFYVVNSMLYMITNLTNWSNNEKATEKMPDMPKH